MQVLYFYEKRKRRRYVTCSVVFGIAVSFDYDYFGQKGVSVKPADGFGRIYSDFNSGSY